MKKIIWIFILVITNLVIISWVVIRFLNLTYPIVGHDYDLAIPSMLDTYLHYIVNGISIQWYTPTFGGGLPAFPDPNNVQFSLVGVSAATGRSVAGSDDHIHCVHRAWRTCLLLFF